MEGLFLASLVKSYSDRVAHSVALPKISRRLSARRVVFIPFGSEHVIT